ncbi:hypothetical protein DPX16_0308 [Anabarilius grahami]|uniref:Uncharacterized protein n=1 Tax=Anabarilius grahami TaxID=495550 RepID=A0A3N0XYM6_ANAGA|nr:hypothetical protein DPX16_0308 [Anabarilius grahami]
MAKQLSAHDVIHQIFDSETSEEEEMQDASCSEDVSEEEGTTESATDSVAVVRSLKQLMRSCLPVMRAQLSRLRVTFLSLHSQTSAKPAIQSSLSPISPSVLHMLSENWLVKCIAEGFGSSPLCDGREMARQRSACLYRGVSVWGNGYVGHVYRSQPDPGRIQLRPRTGAMTRPQRSPEVSAEIESTRSSIVKASSTQHPVAQFLNRLSIPA